MSIGQVFTVNRGDEFVFDITVTKKGEAFDLTGSRVFFALKKNRVNPDPSLIDKSTIFGGINVLNQKAGLARVQLDPADTLALPNETRIYVFDIKVREPDNSVFTVLSGEMIVRASVPTAGV